MSNFKKLKTKKEILKSCGFDFDTFKLQNKKSAKKLLEAMEEYSDQNCDEIYSLINKYFEKLKPLEDLYRKEHPMPDNQFYLPDTTKFYQWIEKKLLKND